MGKNRQEYISKIERRKAERGNTKSGYRLDMAERLIDFPKGFLGLFLDDLTDEDFITYPDEKNVIKLKSLISDKNHTKKERVLLDGGSDAIIKNCYHALFNEGDSIVVSTPSFPMYKIYADMFGMNLIEIGYKGKLKFDLRNVISAIDKSTKMVVLANPNSPYGDEQSKENIKNLLTTLQEKKVYLLLDEAYIDFGGESSVDLVDEFDNLIVLRTFSKAWGAAGARIGYCISNEKNIKAIERVQLTYPISNVTLKFAIYLLNNSDETESYVLATISERDSLISKLKLLGYDVIQSSNNSIHFHDKKQNKDILRILNKHNVSFKTGSTASTPMKVPGDERDTWIRISVGKGILKTPYMQELLAK